MPQLTILTARAWTGLGLVLWAILSGVGFIGLLTYSSTPGEDGIRQRSWPIDTHIALDQTRTNLVVAMHPRCPCSRASLAALEEIVARCPDAVSVTVLFYKPHAESADWTRTDLWKSAAAVPGIHVQDSDNCTDRKRRDRGS